MRAADCLPWFESVIQGFNSLKKYPCSNYSPVAYYYDQEDSRAWAAEAEAAIASVFPPAHPFRQAWTRLEPRMNPSYPHGVTLEQLLGVFHAATKQLRDGRIGTLIDGIRAETEIELLDQAILLLNADHLAASAVIAGGALETHLKRLVENNGVTFDGDGSISKYNDAIAKARNAGIVEVYSSTDGKQVGAWGGLRNDAAHDPANFPCSREQIRLAIDGIRYFISKTTS
jgi:hypothetical protein